MKLGRQVGLGLGHIVLDFNPAPPPSRRGGGTVKMQLGTEVGLGLGPGDIVLDGDQAPPPKKKGGTAPNI